MPLTDFLKRFLGQIALALTLLYFVLLVLEKLIPGFVSPLVDLAQLGLTALVLSGAAVLLSPGQVPRWRRIFDTIFITVLFATLMFYLWTRVSDLGWRGYGLLTAGVFLGCAGYYALWHGRLVE